MGAANIGLQLFSVRGECERNLPGTLKAVAGIGYRAVEPWGYGGEELKWMGCSAAELHRMLDDNGLVCCGIHLTTTALMPANISRTIEFNQVLGNRFLIVAADKQRMSAVEGVRELALILDAAAERLAPLGMFAGYHAHGFDFVKLDGRTAWDILFSSVRPDVVMQLDTGNCASGGADPIDVLRRFPGRARSVHIKDWGKPGAVIGEGVADWPEIFRLCDTLHHTEWYVVEEGSPDGTGFDICARSFAGLKRMGRF